ncbi:hypothetical protein KA001_03195, partial [Patescibacteria group bacterium]|nr:hypothetical protein [Patescibacteria group bacterium]
MKARVFVTYFWGVLMFVFVVFGGFYLITGKNIITGQNRNLEVNNVLAEKDEKITTGKEFVNTEEKVTPTPDTTPTPTTVKSSLVSFNEILSKTNKKTSYTAVNSNKSDKSVVSFNFGFSETDKKYYFALIATGLEDKSIYTVFVANKTDTLKLGEIQKPEEGDEVFRLAKEVSEDLKVFTKAYVLK